MKIKNFKSVRFLRVTLVNLTSFRIMIIKKLINLSTNNTLIGEKFKKDYKICQELMIIKI